MIKKPIEEVIIEYRRKKSIYCDNEGGVEEKNCESVID
jgi:hypothetical protein